MSFDRLPDELIARIASHILETNDINAIRRTDRRWARICFPPTCHGHEFLRHPKKRKEGHDIFFVAMAETPTGNLRILAERGSSLYFRDKDVVVFKPSLHIRPDLPTFVSPFESYIDMQWEPL